MKKFRFLGLVACLFLTNLIHAQEKLYHQVFPLSDVKLLDGPFKHAQDLNVKTLLKYNVDRLLAPYLKEAGLEPKDSSYSNWIGLDGHIGGHYLSAMAIHYASTGNQECRDRLSYMVEELEQCQKANDKDPDFQGYVGGVPNGKSIWLRIKDGDPKAIQAGWVPWYNLHKMYAGLRDAWQYAGNEKARDMFLKFCDWGIGICSNLSDEQMEIMLGTEHGGMNEVYADAYEMTGEQKYLDMAKGFSHKLILNSMASHIDNLDNLHANTQIPKAVGFQRIAEVSGDDYYLDAANFFWERVSQYRSLAFGGNSRQEFFPQADACTDYVKVREGPESCNTNNMLKLTEGLFRMKPDAAYADFYERALYNHILSTQHPVNGGYVYFTPVRPEHYRVYSAPNEAMWCCVGTGMENHGKYGQFIYTHSGDTLFLNLFIPSELHWKEKGVTITQKTQFPYEESTELTITADSSAEFTLMIRTPGWISDIPYLKYEVNADSFEQRVEPPVYIPVRRNWKSGDKIKIHLPMQSTVEELPNVPAYLAFLHGPILLAAKTGTENLVGLIADDSRWGQIASGPLVPAKKIPFILGERKDVLLKIKPEDSTGMHQILSLKTPEGKDTVLELEPFFGIHDARYIMYWLSLTGKEYQEVLDSLQREEQMLIDLDRMTVDKVSPGQQQPEADHNLKSKNSETGIHQDEFYRHATDGGFISYELTTNKETGLMLVIRYWGNEWGPRKFDILIDGEKLASENLQGKWNKSEFVNVEYPVPNEMVKGKNRVEVKLQAQPGNFAGGIYDLRFVRTQKGKK